MVFHFIEHKVEEMEQRLAELEPVLREAEALRESIASLKAALARESGEDPESGVKHDEFAAYMRLPARKVQVAEILAETPRATNQEIADRLGLTAARISQIRSAMAIDKSQT